MIIFKERAALFNYIKTLKTEGKRIGFVPTMGALHKGHISLITNSRLVSDITVASIFVNPTQFNDPSDFQKYPVTLNQDVLQLEQNGCDILFLPTVEEMYPEGTKIPLKYDLGEIEFLLEGKFRPGHFQGVCQVVHKLLDIVIPDTLFMGQKDYQQCMVVKKLIQLCNLPVTLTTSATYREGSGLAMSSRNQRLNEAQQESAATIYKMLVYIRENYKKTEPGQLQTFAINSLLNNGFQKVDYVSIANAETLQPVSEIAEGDHLVALIAASIGEVRLIDNLLL